MGIPWISMKNPWDFYGQCNGFLKYGHAVQWKACGSDDEFPWNNLGFPMSLRCYFLWIFHGSSIDLLQWLSGPFSTNFLIIFSLFHLPPIQIAKQDIFYKILYFSFRVYNYKHLGLFRHIHSHTEFNTYI